MLAILQVLSSSDLQFTPFREAVHLEQSFNADTRTDDDGGSRWVDSDGSIGMTVYDLKIIVTMLWL